MVERDASGEGILRPQEGGRVLEVSAHPASLRLIRRHVRTHAQELGAAADWIGDLVLAVDEACQNIIRYGYDCADPEGEPREGCRIIVETASLPAEDSASGPAAVPATAPVRAMVVRLTDFAEPVDAAKIRARDLEEVRPGGLGVHFIRALTDGCAWVTPPAGAGNVLRLVKRLPGMDAEQGETT